MLVSALLLTISIAWALYDEAFGQRPWKRMQKEFVSRYSKYLDSIKSNAGKTEAEVKESPELLILGTLFDLGFGLARIALDAVEIFRVATDKLLLHALPRTLSKRLVVKRPRNGNRDRKSV